MATLVTIPGIMSDARTWATLARDLESQVDGVHVADTTQDATLEKMAARALHDTRGDLIVVAHSMGGRVAMEMGRQAPERIKAMILSSTSAEGPGANEKIHREVRINAANADMADYGKNWAPKVLSKKNSENGALVARIRQMVEDCGAAVHERQNLALLNRPNATTYVGEFPFPVLLMTGADDHLSTKAVHDATVRRRVAEMIAERTAAGMDGTVEENLLNARGWDFGMDAIEVPVEIFQGRLDHLAPIQGAELLSTHLPNCQLTTFPEHGHFFYFLDWPTLIARASGIEATVGSDRYEIPI